MSSPKSKTTAGWEAKTLDVDVKIRSLPIHGRPCSEWPTYKAEFGYELQGVVPWRYEEHVAQQCDPAASGLPGSRYLYFFSREFVEVPGRRSFGGLPFGNPFNHDTPHVSVLPTANWTMPPWRDFFGNDDVRFDTTQIFATQKPIAMIFNKYNREWGGMPVNYLSIESLRALIGILSPIYQVIYIRMEPDSKLMDNHGPSLRFEDKPMIRREFPSVVLFDELFDNNAMDYNLLVFGLASQAEFFVSVQGGISVVASLWGRPNFIYAVRGSEITKGGFRYRWYGQLAGGDRKSLVTVYNQREELVEDIWRYHNCKGKYGKEELGTHTYIPKQKTLTSIGEVLV